MLALGLGAICFFFGIVCTVSAMSSRQNASFWQVYWRGSFQRKQDYTPEGWRLYAFGRAVAFAGAGLLTLGAILSAQ